MERSFLAKLFGPVATLFFLSLAITPHLFAQSTATIRGTVTDASGAVVPSATVTVQNEATGLARTMTTNTTGAYEFPALPIGRYRLDIKAPGMRAQTMTGLQLQVSQIVVQNVKLGVAQTSNTITVSAEAPVIDSGTMTVGGVINQRTVQEIPLNGRHFVDLGLLIAGTVTPPQNGFLTAPLRGQGSFAINTAGNREDTVNFLINGVNLNDMANGQITFQPSINTVQEFKADNSTYSAENGRNSGAVVHIATRSGSNDWHGEGFDFVRNQMFDARNFFNKETSSTGLHLPQATFKRNNFGVSLGGPIWKNHTFFFFSYEGLRQRQGVSLSTNVPTAADRAAAQADPLASSTALKLLALIPDANQPGGGFVSSATAPVNIDQWTGDVSHNFSESDRLHGYYAIQRDKRQEPNLQGNNIPGFGDTRQSRRQIFTLNETHIFNPRVVNEFRFGYNRIHITFVPDSKQDPSTFGINNGLTGPVGLPQIAINDLGLTFGGIRNFPQGRGDYTGVLSDTVNYLRGNHSLKFGGEFRRFNGNSFTLDDGGLGFATFDDFVHGVVNAAPATFVNQGVAFSMTQGSRPARVFAHALGLFAQDSYKVTPNLTLELGLRWEWNMSPTEAVDRSVNFFPATDSLVRLGTNGYKDTINQNSNNFEPRVGFAWDLFHDGNTVLRGGYGYQVDQFLPGPLVLSGNPPLATPLQAGASTFGTLVTDAAAAGLSPAAIDTHFKNAYVQSWNLNLQHSFSPSMGMMIGYFGSKGTHLNLAINENQKLSDGTRPFSTLSPSSPILPGAKVGNVTENISGGNSNYSALWVTGTKHLSHGLQFDASYTWSKSLDYNSRNFQGVTVQNSLDPRGDYGPSDFDARHRFVISSLYELPLKGNRFLEGWRLSGILQLQSGNPLNVTFANSTLTGTATLRPDLLATPVIVNQINSSGFVQWFAPNAVCDPTIACPAGAQFALPTAGGLHFGDMRRNSVVGPSFENLDFSITKVTKITERISNEFRVEAFDILNHANFGNPGLSAQIGSSSFGVIKSTRFPTGDSGSARQLQFGMKLIF
jgi:carboxypeptidase family protein/TonB-dependent receptor-like protein